MFRKFIDDDSGATMVEYGLIGALVSVAAVFALLLVGDGIQGVFGASQSALEVGAEAAVSATGP